MCKMIFANNIGIATIQEDLIREDSEEFFTLSVFLDKDSEIYDYYLSQRERIKILESIKDTKNVSYKHLESLLNDLKIECHNYEYFGNNKEAYSYYRPKEN